MIKRILFFTIIHVSLLGCTDIFDPTDNQYQLIDKESEEIDLLNGIYSEIAQAYDLYSLYPLLRSDDFNFYNSYNFPNSNFSETNIECSQNGSSDFQTYVKDGVENMYLKLYQAITTANTLINRSQINTPHHIGEAHFLRAYCYFTLVRLFKSLPLIDDTEVNYTVKASGPEELYLFIEEELLNAIDLLPESTLEARVPYETPTKNAAKALLAEVYLNMAGYPLNQDSYYKNSAELAKEVIQSNAYKLCADYNELWNTNDKHNEEYLFGLMYNPELEINDWGWIEGDIFNNYAGVSSYHTFSFESYSFNWDNFNPTFQAEFHFYDRFPNSYRKECTYRVAAYQEYSFEVDGETNRGTKYNVYSPSQNPCDYIDKTAIIKHFDINELRQMNTEIRRFESETNLYFLRYASTLLTFAEAKARMNDIDAEAYEAINQVRRRANKLSTTTESKYDLTPGLSQTQFIDSVVWERAFELAHEPNGRWFDIIRLDLKEKLNEYRYAYDYPVELKDDLLNDDWYYYNIPQSDTWLNPNLEK